MAWPLESPTEPSHVVVIVGGAVAGSEAAVVCADRGARVIVVEQNPRPYGKIEDGLPRWHVALRKKEYQRIDANLNRPGVAFLPQTRLGTDVTLGKLVDELGVSAVVLANGAWRDRPLAIEGIDAYLGKGLAYQNPFVYWFNHYPERDYRGPGYEVEDGAIVVGGGLASIDVVKILNLELYSRALRSKGIDVDLTAMEVKGIDFVCQKHGVDPASLGVAGCTLYYRRRKQDMPLASADDDLSPEELGKIETTRAKIMDKVIRKYRVRFEECSVPVAPLVRQERLAGLVFRRTEVAEGRLREVPGSDFEVSAPLVVSSIGSVPEPVPEVPRKGELYRWASWETGALEGFDRVIGLGNVLTGKGNIKASRQNARVVAARLMGGAVDGAALDQASDALHASSREQAKDAIGPVLERNPKLSVDRVRTIANWASGRAKEAGYEFDYARWIANVTPSDMV